MTIMMQNLTDTNQSSMIFFKIVERQILGKSCMLLVTSLLILLENICAALSQHSILIYQANSMHKTCYSLAFKHYFQEYFFYVTALTIKK